MRLLPALRSRSSRRRVAAVAGLLLAGLAVPLAAPASATPAARFSWPAGSGTSYADPTSVTGTARLTWSDAVGTGSVSAASTSTALVVRAAGDQCEGAPQLTVTVDGRTIGTQAVASTGWAPYRFAGPFPAGAHRVGLSFDNDHQGSSCDRNLRLDRAVFVSGDSGTASNPLAGATFWVDPQSDSVRTAAALRGGDPTGAALFDKIAGVAGSEFLGDWVPAWQVQQHVADRVASVGSAVPLFVLYALPHRDCGSYSGGGLADAAAYRDWVGRVAAGLGTHRSVVVVEPDALAQLDCLSAGDRTARMGMLREAVGLLAAHPATTVYLDAGNSTWQPVDVMAARLRDAGVSATRGFSLNVANFHPTGGELAYGDALSAALGGAHFVVDTSRNGRGPAPTWCNPTGQALGARPTTATGDPLADALLWVKRVGESDGTCGGGPAAGSWWPDYARGLAARASW